MILTVVDMHTAGEPVRIVTGGYPRLAGRTILDKRREARERHDHLRRALMLEPRGHAGMYGVIPVEPGSAGAAIGALFMHNEGYSTMCGHATVALGRWLVESGRVPPVEPLTRFALELPCGVVQVACDLAGGKVTRTTFESVPAFASHRDLLVEVGGGLGPVRLDIAYGGAFYAILPSTALGLDFLATPLARLTEAAVAVTEAVRRSVPISHPEAEDLGFLYGTILTDGAPPPAPSFNLCVFAERQIDRSPTGSGVTARMALDHARGAIGTGVERTFMGPTGLPFGARVIREAGSPGSVIVAVSGTSAFSGEATFRLEDDDPLAHGFALPRSYGELLKEREK